MTEEQAKILLLLHGYTIHKYYDKVLQNWGNDNFYTFVVRDSYCFPYFGPTLHYIVKILELGSRD